MTVSIAHGAGEGRKEKQNRKKIKFPTKVSVLESVGRKGQRPMLF